MVVRIGDFKSTGTLDWTQALTDAAGADEPVWFPVGRYTVLSTITLQPGTHFYGLGSVILDAPLTSSTSTLFKATSANGIRLEGLTCSYSSSVLPMYQPLLEFTDCAGLRIRELITINGRNGAISLVDCDSAKVEDVDVFNTRGVGVRIDSCDNVVVDASRFGSHTSFCIYLINGSSKCTLTGNKTTSNGLELIGVTAGCSEQFIFGNHAQGTGDNGISVTADDCRVIGNHCEGNWNNGIGVYGSRNLISTNVCLSNGRRHSEGDRADGFAGIKIQAAFGGTGKDNLIIGNDINDRQAALGHQNSIRGFNTSGNTLSGNKYGASYEAATSGV